MRPREANIMATDYRQWIRRIVERIFDMLVDEGATERDMARVANDMNLYLYDLSPDRSLSSFAPPSTIGAEIEQTSQSSCATATTPQ
jgi:hypothetical protein